MDKKSPLFMRLVSCGNGCVFASGVFPALLCPVTAYTVSLKGLWYEPRLPKRNLNLLDNYFKPRINIMVSEFPDPSHDLTLMCQIKIYP